MKTNAYNFSENGCVFYHAIAIDEAHAIELAREAGYNIEGMEIELEKENVRNQLGQSYECRIEEALA